LATFHALPGELSGERSRTGPGSDGGVGPVTGRGCRGGWCRFEREGNRFGWRRRGCRRRQGNTELDGPNLMDIDCLRLIPDLDVKLLGVAGLYQPRDLVAILQGDDIGEEPTAGQQAELPEDEQNDSSHIHLLDDAAENDPEIQLASHTS